MHSSFRLMISVLIIETGKQTKINMDRISTNTVVGKMSPMNNVRCLSASVTRFGAMRSLEHARTMPTERPLRTASSAKCVTCSSTILYNVAKSVNITVWNAIDAKECVYVFKRMSCPRVTEWKVTQPFTFCRPHLPVKAFVESLAYRLCTLNLLIGHCLLTCTNECAV